MGTDGLVSAGPTPETEAVLGGFSIVEVPSREVALEWAARLARAQEVRESGFDPRY